MAGNCPASREMPMEDRTAEIEKTRADFENTYWTLHSTINKTKPMSKGREALFARTDIGSYKERNTRHYWTGWRMRVAHQLSARK